MADIEWSAELEIGVKIFDEHHKKWVKLYNEVHQALVELKGVDSSDFLKKAIDEFLVYTFYHLKTEEDAMRRFEYPEYEEHKKEHDKYRFLIQEVKRVYKNNPEKGGRLLLEFLEEWLLKHIKQTDKKYSYFIPSDLEEVG